MESIWYLQSQQCVCVCVCNLATLKILDPKEKLFDCYDIPSHLGEVTPDAYVRTWKVLALSLWACLPLPGFIFIQLHKPFHFLHDPLCEHNWCLLQATHWRKGNFGVHFEGIVYDNSRVPVTKTLRLPVTLHPGPGSREMICCASCL